MTAIQMGDGKDSPHCQWWWWWCKCNLLWSCWGSFWQWWTCKHHHYWYQDQITEIVIGLHCWTFLVHVRSWFSRNLKHFVDIGLSCNFERDLYVTISNWLKLTKYHLLDLLSCWFIVRLCTWDIFIPGQRQIGCLLFRFWSSWKRTHYSWLYLNVCV